MYFRCFLFILTFYPHFMKSQNLVSLVYNDTTQYIFLFQNIMLNSLHLVVSLYLTCDISCFRVKVVFYTFFFSAGYAYSHPTHAGVCGHTIWSKFFNRLAFKIILNCKTIMILRRLNNYTSCNVHYWFPEWALQSYYCFSSAEINF